MHNRKPQIYKYIFILLIVNPHQESINRKDDLSNGYVCIVNFHSFCLNIILRDYINQEHWNMILELIVGINRLSPQSNLMKHAIVKTSN